MKNYLEYPRGSRQSGFELSGVNCMILDPFGVVNSTKFRVVTVSCCLSVSLFVCDLDNQHFKYHKSQVRFYSLLTFIIENSHVLSMILESLCSHCVFLFSLSHVICCLFFFYRNILYRLIIHNGFQTEGARLESFS